MKKIIRKGVSVIIPTFNRVKYLYPTLLCLTNQKVSNTLEYEIIVVDSGDDETESVVRMFQNSGKVSIIYERIKKCKNRSLLRNTGAGLANYSILCFLDNDMLTPPEFIQTHFDEHERSPHTVVMGARRFLTEFNIYEFGEEKLLRDFNSLEELPWYGDERLYEDISVQSWRFAFSHTLSIDQADFNLAGKFNVGFGNHWGFEDVELGVRLQKINCMFRLISNSFTYHQPHFQQSNTEQHEKSYNEILFMKTHNCYESELYKCFYTSFLEYYLSLKKVEKDFEYPNKSTLKKFDVVLGALNSLNGTFPQNAKMHLGTYCVEETNSKDKVLILPTFFKFPEIIKISILFEAYRISPKVYFEDITSEQEDEIISLSLASGVVVKVEKYKNYTIFVRDWNQDSKLFLVLLPDVLQPEKRYVYLWLAQKLLKTNHFVKIRDMKNTTVLDKEDFNLETESRSLIENNIDRYFGKNRLQFITSSSMVMTDMQIEIPKTKSSYIFFDDDYQLNYVSTKSRHIGVCTCYDETVYSLLSVLSIYDNIRDIRKQFNEVRNNSFCCFMENGFLEDGIDCILNAFEKYSIEHEDAILTVKVPDYEEINKEVFPLHNESSRKAKTFASLQKFQKDYELLNSYISNYKLEQKVQIIRKNLSVSEILEIVAKNESFICAQRTCCGNPQLYAAILLKKNVIIPKHLNIPKVLKSFCLVIDSEQKIFAEELQIPVSCLNSGYSAFHVKEDDLQKALSQKSNTITDELETEIIENGKKFFNDLFG